MGGVGKSSVALKYARQWKEWYGDGVLLFNGDGVLLFNGESYPSLHTSVRQNVTLFQYHIMCRLLSLLLVRCVVCPCLLVKEP